jgi:hypothetical protein
MSEILNSLQSVNDELTAIQKNQQGHNYKFRGIDQVLNTLSPLFKKYKILVSRRNLVSERSIREIEGKYGKKMYVETFIKKCDYVFTSTIDGSEFISQGFGEGQDTSGGDKSASMATSNSYKYVIFEMFSIATEEQKDSDQQTAIEAKRGDAEEGRMQNQQTVPKKTINDLIKDEYTRLISEGMTKELVVQKFGTIQGKKFSELQEVYKKMKAEKFQKHDDEILNALNNMQF